MKNKDVVDEFVNYGTDETIKTKHLFFEQDVLFSYGYHFPLCIRLKDCWIINSDGYSNTTAHHKGLVIRGLSGCPVIYKSTRELKELMQENLDKGFRYITIEEIQKLRIVKSL